MTLNLVVIVVPCWKQVPNVYALFGLPMESGGTSIVPVCQSPDRFIGETLTSDWGVLDPQELLPSSLRSKLDGLQIPSNYKWRLRHYELEDWDSLSVNIEEDVTILTEIVRENRKLIQAMPQVYLTSYAL